MQPSTSTSNVNNFKYNGSQADFSTFAKRLESNRLCCHLLLRPPARLSDINVTGEEIERDAVANKDLFYDIRNFLSRTMTETFENNAWNAPYQADGHGVFVSIRDRALDPNNPIDQLIADRAAAHTARLLALEFEPHYAVPRTGLHDNDGWRPLARRSTGWGGAPRDQTNGAPP